MANNPTHIIIHCSDSPWGNAKEIDKWHKQRGFSGIGYHLIILNGHVLPDEYLMFLKGSVEEGRYLNDEGAHCIGYNDHSIGICLIGNGPETFCLEQFDKLKEIVYDLGRTYKISPENILGHGETESGKKEGKTCPNFDVGPLRNWYKERI